MMNQYMKKVTEMNFDVDEFQVGSCWEISSPFETTNGIVVSASPIEVVFLAFDIVNGIAVRRTVMASAVANGQFTLTKLVNPNTTKKPRKKKDDMKTDWGDMIDAMAVGKLQSDADKSNAKDGFDIINDIKSFSYHEGRN